MMQNFVCMCTFISVSYKKHKGKETLSWKSNPNVNLYGISVWYLCQLNHSQNFLDSGNKRKAIAVLLLQKLY